jgi:hypothetical protein
MLMGIDWQSPSTSPPTADLPTSFIGIPTHGRGH